MSRGIGPAPTILSEWAGVSGQVPPALSNILARAASLRLVLVAALRGRSAPLDVLRCGRHLLLAKLARESSANLVHARLAPDTR
eukprot:2125158-Pyramimonas_sp.AAC.1